MKTPLMDWETYAYARIYGYTLSIGQVTKEWKRDLEGQVRRGSVRKCRAYFPDLMGGYSPLKMCYVNLSQAAQKENSRCLTT